jgi:putative membrane-bound dehydrogenase-like protein
MIAMRLLSSSNLGLVFLLTAAFVVLQPLDLFICHGAAQENDDKTIRALLVTGGCCHDYETQKKILSEGISARCGLKIDWTIIQQGGTATNSKIDLYQDADWAQDFDIVIHNECFSDVDDKEWVERILKPHREGVAAIVIHCAMHSYRQANTADWRDFLGVTSPGHGAHYAYDVENLEKEHPIMKGFGEKWTTPKGELYFVDALGPKTTPLARAFSKDKQRYETCVWTNEFGKARVFGTTIGHHNETMSEVTYLNMMTRGFLWALDKLEEEHVHEAPKQKSRENIARDKPATASASQEGHDPAHAVDGSLETRWCAPNNAPGCWWQVDLEKSQEIFGCAVRWEQANRKYDFKIEGSANGDDWNLLLDKTDNDSRQQTQVYQFNAENVRYMRMTVTGAESGAWPSFFEFAVLGAKEIEVDSSDYFQAFIDPATEYLGDVVCPPEFTPTIFAAPPQVNYPVCLCASADGTIYVGVDKNGSLDRQRGRGSVMRCRDLDDDGVADEIKKFCDVDSPRGLIWDRDRLYVLHPPDLSVFLDEDLDGVADRKETLVSGVGFDLDFRGADHTTNGIRLGIDGWIYIAVGDYGFIQATGTDERTLQMKGGGVVRVRPDGSELELFAHGLRNVLDVCIDPRLNMFTRDNTNDGGGWDVRLSHILQSAKYGYPSWYKNFEDEILPPMADYGGGSGCGGMFVEEPALPEKYRSMLLTCDWGRNEVYWQPLKQAGATFQADQQSIIKLTRPTDVDADALGNLYVSSWRGGQFNYAGEYIGYVARVSPKGAAPQSLPDYLQLTYDQLLDELTSGSHIRRLTAQRELLFRLQTEQERETFQSKHQTRFVELMQSGSIESRIAAIFTFKQIFGSSANQQLAELAQADDQILEYVIRAMTDRTTQLENVSQRLLVEGLDHKNPRVKLAALVAIGRTGIAPDVGQIIALTDYQDGTQKVIDSERAISHVAVQTLVKLNAVEPCLAALAGPHRAGAIRALRQLHTSETVRGLSQLASTTDDSQLRLDALALLTRLYSREGPYTGKWWGTRPDTSGPYYNRDRWEETAKIEAALRASLPKLDDDSLVKIFAELEKHKVQLPGLPAELMAKVKSASDAAEIITVSIPKFDPNDPKQIGNIDYESVLQQTLKAKGDVQEGAQLFRQQSCVACHTIAGNQQPVGPQLMDIGKRYKSDELVESMVKPSAKIAQGFATNLFELYSGKTVTGFVVREAADEVEIRTSEGKPLMLKIEDIEVRSLLENSAMPDGLVNNLTTEQLASLLAYLESLKSKE